jgi:hypothetical protein
MRLLSVLLLVLPAVPAVIQGQRPDSLHTRFDWPVGLVARVDVERIRSKRLPERAPDSTRFAASYRLRVLGHERGRLVQADSFVLHAAPRLGAVRRSLPEDLTASIQPSYVVSETGEFRGVANIDRMKAFVDSAVASSEADSKLTAEQRGALASIVSADALTAIAAQFWDAAVGTWADEDWVIGRRYRGSSPTAVAWLPGFELQLDYTLAAEARVACNATDANRGCVRLRMHSRPDSASLREFLVAFSRMARLDGSENFATMMRDTRLDTEVVVIAEPRTLRPHDVSISRHTRFVVPSTARERGGSVATTDVQRYRYTY